MALVYVHCPECQSIDVVQYGKQANGTQRYRCNNRDCPRTICLLQYSDKGRLPAVQLQELLAPFGITRFYTDGWGAYHRHLDPSMHTVGKQHTQKIERKHITFRTRIKRLTRKSICFSRSILMHDLVIGLFINRYEFGYVV